MDYTLEQQAELRAHLLKHRILSRLPRQALEKLLFEAEFLFLDEFQASFSGLKLGQDLYFLLEGRLILFHSPQKSHIALLKEHEDFFGGPYFRPYDLLPVSPRLVLLKISSAQQNELIQRFPEIREILFPCFLPLGTYLFFKIFSLPALTSIPASVLDCFKLELFASNSYIVRKGEVADKFYIISYGSAWVYLNYAEASQTVVRTLEAGDFFGEVGLLEDSIRHATIKAASQMALFSLNKADFERLLETPEGHRIHQALREQTRMYTFRETNIIGSASDCNPRILDAHIAPHHIKLSKKQDPSGQILYSLKPACDPHKFHTFINKHPIDREVILQTDDEIIIGSYKILIDPVQDQITVVKIQHHLLEIYNLQYSFKGQKIIDRISFLAQSKQLIGILGNSGSGKSTLLELIYGSKNPSSGQILYDQTPLQRNRLYYHNICGFVPQDDILYPTLTVYENLYFAAKIRFPMEPTEKLNRRIDQVLDILKLGDKKYQTIGSIDQRGLSGGQKKRVNIARELIFDPDILFLDEPTSGLSSQDAEEVIHFLRILADTGKMVITVLHQPNSRIYKQLDQVILLDEGGKLIFAGSGHACLSYLDAFKEDGDFLLECPQCLNVHPEKIFEIVNQQTSTGKRKYSPAEWQSHFAQQQGLNAVVSSPLDQENLVLPHRRLNGREHLLQLGALIQRSFLLKLRDRSNLLAQLLTPLALALLIALLFRSSPADMPYSGLDNHLLPAFLFVSTILMSFLGATGSAKDIVGEQSILFRELKSNLRIIWYVHAKFMIQGLLTGIQLTLYLSLSLHILAIPESFALFFPFLWLAGLFGVSMGLTLSSSIKSSEAVVNLIPLLLIPQIILGGGQIPYKQLNRDLFLNQKQLQIPEIAHLMPARWVYEGLVIAGNSPRETMLKQQQVLRDHILLPRLQQESSPAADQNRLQTQILELDLASGEIEKKYPEQRYPFRNRALSLLLEQGLEDFFKAELAMGQSVTELNPALITGLQLTPPSQAQQTLFNSAFCAPIKALPWGNRRLQIPTLVFNTCVLLLMMSALLLLSILSLRLRSQTR